MTPVGNARLQRELVLGWRPLVIRPVKILANLEFLTPERVYDATERHGTVYALVGTKAVEVRPEEYEVLAWGISEEALKKIGVRA